MRCRLLHQPLQRRLRQYVVRVAAAHIRVSANEPPLFNMGDVTLGWPLLTWARCLHPKRWLKCAAMLVDRQRMEGVGIVDAKINLKEVEGMVKAGTDLKAIAKAVGGEVKTSEDFTRDGAIQGVGQGAQFAELFGKEPGAMVGPLNISGQVAVAKLVSKTPAEMGKLAAVIKTKTRDEWDAIMLGSDVCYAPVLSISEAPKHPHNVARQTFVDVDGVVQPAPAPRFSRTVPDAPTSPQAPDTAGALKAWGFSADEIATLAGAGAI